MHNTTKKQIQWKDKDKKEVRVDKNHKKKLKKAHSITQDTNIKATHLLMQMEQLMNSDAGHKSVPAVAGGCLRHIIKVYKLANLRTRDMCVEDAKEMQACEIRKSIQKILYK